MSLRDDVPADATFVATPATGVYCCRASCAARAAAAGSARFFRSAAAAQAAGFRPCLRCRPELAPELTPWPKAEALARALALVRSGHFDEHRLDTLAARLDLAESELQKAFHEYYGASAESLREAHRMLLAKRLVTDTALPIVDVARACGFASAAECGAHFRRLYGRSATRLRRARSRPSGPGTIELALAYKPPYDWAAIIDFLAPRAITGVEVANSTEYARSIRFGDVAGSVVVRPAPRRHSLLVTIRFPAPEFLPAIVERVRSLFDLGADPSVIGRHLAGDAVLAPLVAKRPGVRVPGAWDGFEIAVRAILGQEVTVKAASIFAGRLATHYGEPLPDAERDWPTGVTHLFPRPERIAAATDLASVVGLPRKRAAAIVSLGSAVAADPTLLTLGSDLEASIARLVALHGIGQWTAHYIAMRVLHEPDAFPAADVGLLRMMANEAGRPKPKELLARATPWQPWRAYAVMQLWTSGSSLAAKKAAKTKARGKDGSHRRKRRLTDRGDPPRR